MCRASRRPGRVEAAAVVHLDNLLIIDYGPAVTHAFLLPDSRRPPLAPASRSPASARPTCIPAHLSHLFASNLSPHSLNSGLHPTLHSTPICTSQSLHNPGTALPQPFPPPSTRSRLTCSPPSVTFCHLRLSHSPQLTFSHPSPSFCPPPICNPRTSHSPPPILLLCHALDFPPSPTHTHQPSALEQHAVLPVAFLLSLCSNVA